MKIQSIRQLKKLTDQCVLVRVDFNVPIVKGKVKEEYKIEKSIPTIAHLLRAGAKVIMVSHLGRPEGKYEKKLSLKPVLEPLREMLKADIEFLTDKKCDDNYWKKAKAMVTEMVGGQVLLLENIRFFDGEEKNDKKLSKALAGLADIFVLDGFAVAHRAASSVSGVADFLPAYAGLLLEEEVDGLSKVLKKPAKPFVVVLAGIKIETKIPVLKKILPLADHILLGGGIFNTYLAATGHQVGTSAVDTEYFPEAIKYCVNKKIILPVDVIVGHADGKKARAFKIDKDFNITDNKMAIYDIGPETVKLYTKYIKTAETLVWNGAMGFFEQHPYEYGTHAIARLIASRSTGKAFGVCGGGETVETLKRLHLMEDIDLVSTGGGAMLEFLSGKILPGIKAVSKK